MAGYDGFSRSNNAVRAESAGLMTATAAAAALRAQGVAGCTAADVRKALRWSERHHTSSHYNMTPYYDIHDLDGKDEAAVRATIEKRKAAKTVAQTYEGTWAIKNFSGSRNRPVFDPYQVTGTITVKGKWATLPDGSRKRIDGVRLVETPADDDCEAWKKGRALQWMVESRQ